jgi:SAM-dependent methyltransferase
LKTEGRWPKAEKIASLLGLKPAKGRRLRLLEVGTGSGAIAAYFASREDLDCEVDAVDVVDQRQVEGTYRFQCVGGVVLPFAAEEFDVVISNHVIEHVGDRAQQQLHVDEIARVLRNGGVAYLAVPSRWQLVEPHYHLAFLSWLPRPLRSTYLRLRRGGSFYDCEPLGMHELERMLAASGFRYSNMFEPALRIMAGAEGQKSRLLQWMARMPAAWLRRMRPLSPTHVYCLTHSEQPVHARTR